MDNLRFRVAGVSDLGNIHTLAHEIWPLVYDYMISAEQIQYMLKWMYSPESLLDQMQNGHEFIILESPERSFGFASFHQVSDDRFRLNKLYLHPELHGKGWGKRMLMHVIEAALYENAKLIELNVNKNNRSIVFYRANGFEIESEEVIDIGGGYVMDDYIMTRKL